MRRILLILIMGMLFISHVRAEDFSEWSEIKPEGDNLIVETQKRYRYYREFEVGEYLPLENNSNYKNVVMDNYQYSSWTNWGVCDDNLGSEKETRTIYPYQTVDYTRHFRIGNVSTDALVNQILFYYNGNRVSINLENCLHCDSLFWTIDKGGQMTFNTYINYDTSKLSFDISFNNDEVVYYDLIIYKTIYPFVETGRIKANSTITHYEVDASWLDNTIYTDIQYSDVEVIGNDFVKVLPKEENCRYRNQLFYHYNIEKEYYSDEYYLELDEEEYLKDEEDYKIYYRYQEKPIITKEKEIIPEEAIPIYKTEEIPENTIIQLPEEVIKEIDIVTKEVDLEVLPKDNNLSLVNPLSLKDKNLSMKFIITIVIFLLIVSSLVIAKKLKRMSND